MKPSRVTISRNSGRFVIESNMREDAFYYSDSSQLSAIFKRLPKDGESITYEIKEE